MNFRNILSFIAVTLCLIQLNASTITKHLYINRGTFTTVKNTTFPFLAFNASASYNSLNEVVAAATGDSVKFVVINNDTALHAFSIKGTSVSSSAILPGDSFLCSISSPLQRAFIYYDSYQYPKNRYLGLAGIIYFGPVTQTYFWNFKEHQTAYSNTLASGVNWSMYEPDYFTINSKSFPDVQVDTMTKVNAQIGDTVYIIAANTGQSAHSLHFHGFHLTAVDADAKIAKTGWEKDTWGMFSMDILVLRMIPDKAGLYSVHDHNLAAITGGNTHPNGMFTIMTITP